MDWLRSEDLKEEKNVTAPKIYYSSPSAVSLPKGSERTIGHASNLSRTPRPRFPGSYRYPSSRRARR